MSSLVLDGVAQFVFFEKHDLVLLKVIFFILGLTKAPCGELCFFSRILKQIQDEVVF